MKFHEWVEDKSKNAQQADECKDAKPKEKTAHPAEEAIRAHAFPRLARGRPFFILGPPGRALTMGKAAVRFHNISCYVLRTRCCVLTIRSTEHATIIYPQTYTRLRTR